MNDTREETRTTNEATATHAQVYANSFPWKVFVPGVLGAAASVVEPVMAAPVLDEVVDLVDGVNMSAYIAIAILLLNVGLAMELGKAKADIETDRKRKWSHLATLIVTTILWLAIGLAMGALRWHEAILTGTSKEVLQTDQVLAGLMFVLHLASGACIFAATHGYLSSAYHMVHAPLRRANQADKAAAASIAYAEQTNAALAKNTTQSNLYEADLNAHLTTLRNTEAQLKDQFRIMLAAHLANPAATGLLATPMGTTNATETPPHPTNTKGT